MVGLLDYLDFPVAPSLRPDLCSCSPRVLCVSRKLLWDIGVIQAGGVVHVLVVALGHFFSDGRRRKQLAVLDFLVPGQDESGYLLASSVLGILDILSYHLCIVTCLVLFIK